MMIQPLLRSHSESSSGGRTSTDGESPNEMFARTLAESIRAARGGNGHSPGHIGNGSSWSGFERAGNRLDPRSEMAVTRSGDHDDHEPTRPPVDRPERSDGDRSGDRGHERTGRVEVARPGETDRPGAQVVDPSGDPIRPDTSGSGKGRRVAFANETGGTDQAGELDGQDSPLATALASLMGVDAADAAAFLETLMAGLTRSQGVESAEALMAELAALAQQLTGGETTAGSDGIDGADTELVTAVIDAAVEAGLVEPMAPDAGSDPAAVLAALAATIPGGGTVDPAGDEPAGIDQPTGVDESDAVDSGAGSGLDTPDDPTILQPADGAEVEARTATDPSGSEPTVKTGTEARIPTGDAGSDPTGDIGTEVDVPAETSGSKPTAETGTEAGIPPDSTGSPDTETDGIAPGPAVGRTADNSTGTTSNGLNTVSGVAPGPPTAAARTTTPTPPQGLVELANNRLAEQLRPAFAAVRRGIDGLEELQLRLRNEGGAPIRVDISTGDGEVRVVLSGTNDDVMQRLGQERERLADELRRAGFTSTTIDVHSEGNGDGDRRPGTRPSLESASGRGYDSGTSEEATVGALSGTDRSTLTGLDLDL